MPLDVASEQLAGEELDGGWTVVERLTLPDAATGGNFSTGYLVERTTGERAYLKALDWARAMESDSPVDEVKRLTNAFDFERTVVNKCRDQSMDRVVMALDHGSVRVEDADGPSVVPYLIFELADGDIREELSEEDRYEEYWILRALHDIATGLRQLHSAAIAHQDVKPSNVLLFEDGEDRKIGDLGRAAYKGHSPPHEDLTIAGDPKYAPPELLYGHVRTDWTARRYGCDAYLLGSMAVFFFMGVGTTALLADEIAPEHYWLVWPGDYEEVLPHVREAFGRVMRRVEDALPSPLDADLIPTIRYLCEPDPDRRGHPKEQASGNQYNLQRFIARFNLLAKRSRFGRYR